MKRNVLEWICGTMNDATSVIVLTQNIDFLFLQQIAYPNFQKCGNPKMTVFADAACASATYGQQRPLIDSGLGNHYRVVNVCMAAGRRFHPKAILLSGPTKAALAIGSGNLTHGGWGANREIWASFESDCDELEAFAAFKSYLQIIIGLANEPHAIKEDVLAPFSENEWASNMPHPNHLIGTPHDRPILDRLYELYGTTVTKITAYAPYYDPKGRALSDLAGRFKVPVEVWVQPKHVGLTESAKLALPSNINFKSVDVTPKKFIHAKLYIMQRQNDAILAVGSANLSQAALLADKTWGNAELLAYKFVTIDEVQELVSDILILDEPIDFPEDPPQDDWTTSETHFQVLSAHHTSGILEIKYDATSKIDNLIVEMENGARKTCGIFTENGSATLKVEKCPNSIRLHSVQKGTEPMVSEFCWVHNEDSLSISISRRRIADELAKVSELNAISYEGFQRILKLVHLNINEPEKKMVHSASNEVESDSIIKSVYHVETAFSDTFDKFNPVKKSFGNSENMDIVNVIASVFSINNLVEFNKKKGQQSKETATESKSGENQQSDEITDKATLDELDQDQMKDKEEEPTKAQKQKILAICKKIKITICAENFIPSRSPADFQECVVTAALVLRIGLEKKFISEPDFMNLTEYIWNDLFFGKTDKPSALEAHITSSLEDERVAFQSIVSSPRLTSALIYWRFPNWTCDSADASEFKFLAMIIAAEFPWLISDGVPIDEVHQELVQFSQMVDGSATHEALILAWKTWIQAGIAFREFKLASDPVNTKQLVNNLNCEKVHARELVWQGNDFYICHAECSRLEAVNAYVHSLTRDSHKKYRSNWLVPVASLLNDDNPLNMNNCARALLKKILEDYQASAAYQELYERRVKNFEKTNATRSKKSR